MVASNYKPYSEIALVNQKPINEPISISADLYNILEIAQNVYKISDSFYDISLGKVSLYSLPVFLIIKSFCCSNDSTFSL